MRDRARVAHWTMQAVARALMAGGAVAALLAVIGVATGGALWYALALPAGLIAAGGALWSVDLPRT